MSRSFNIEELDAHFQKMKLENIFPDSYTFTILLNEYKHKNPRWRRLQKLLQQQSILKPTTVTQTTKNVLLHSIISTFSKSKEREFYSTSVRDLHHRNDVHTLTTLIASYRRSKNWSKIVNIHCTLQSRQIKLDRYFYRVLVQSLLDGRKYRECMEAITVLLASDKVMDQIFGLECKIRHALAIFKNTRFGKKIVVENVDQFLKFSDEKGLMITAKQCNLIAVAFLNIFQEDIAVDILESRYHAQGRFRDVEEGRGLGMSSWTILMRAYSRKGKRGISKIRSCVERALSKGSEPPTKTFLSFLYRLGLDSELRSTNPKDCDFFLQKRQEYISKPQLIHRKVRSHFTKTNILRWMNNLDQRQLEDKLRETVGSDHMKR
jgi:hypothetical protein